MSCEEKLEDLASVNHVLVMERRRMRARLRDVLELNNRMTEMFRAILDGSRIVSKAEVVEVLKQRNRVTFRHAVSKRGNRSMTILAYPPRKDE